MADTPSVSIPVPDPNRPPKPSAQMEREGEREGEVLVERDHSQSAPDDESAEVPDFPSVVPPGD
jgi:hypothetical protein